MTNGERLRALRLERGLTVKEMAKALGITPQGYLRLEDGTGGKTLEKVPVLARVLRCTTDQLFPEMDEPVEEAKPAAEAEDSVPLWRRIKWKF